jgi:iron complex transport system permease protein
MKQQNFVFIMLCLMLLLLVFVMHVFIGRVHISLHDWRLLLQGKMDAEHQWQMVIVQSRLLTASTALVSGIALALSGWQMQTFFRNPVAGPFVLGISSGASMTVALFVMAGSYFGMQGILNGALGNWSLALVAFIGSMLFSALILLLSTKLKSMAALLVTGLMLGSASAALVTILQSYSSKTDLQNYIFWSFGSYADVTAAQLLVICLVVFPALVASLFLLKPLNLLLMGEDYAVSMGLSLKKTRLAVMITCSLLAAVVTAFCGPIAFIGLAVPHFARSLTRSADHKKLFPVIILLGAITSIICSLITQLPISDKVIPLNAVTSAIGAPFVIWIIIRKPFMIS